MKSTMQYSVGGNIIDIADDRLDEFLADAKADGEKPEEVFTFYVEGEPVQVLASRVDEFMADCEADGVKPNKRRGIAMDDGTVLHVDPYAFEQVAQARRQGFDVSRSMLKKAGIPEQYAKSREQRNWLAQRFAENFFADQITDEERAKMMGVGEDDIEIDETAGLRTPDAQIEEPDSPLVAGIKGFGEGLKRSVTDFGNLMDETYGEDSVIANAMKGASDFSNKAARTVADIPAAVNDVAAEVVGLGERIGGGDGELKRTMRDQSAAYRQAVEEATPTDTAYIDPSLKPVSDFAQDTLLTIGKFAIPGMAPVAISADTANAFYDAYERAIANGASEDKAEGLAMAKAGVTAAMGMVLGKAARGARGAAGFKGALADMAVTGGEMATVEGAGDIVEQGIEGADNPDWKRVAKKMTVEGAKGAAFSGMSRAVHGAADGFGSEARASRERIRKTIESERNRRDAEELYESKLSDEAMNDIDQTIANQVDAETIPSWRHAEEVKRRAIEKLGSRENGESHEAVEQAVIEAADEVNARINTRERVESAALERRQAEYEMKLKEAQAKRAAEAKKYGKAKTPLPEPPKAEEPTSVEEPTPEPVAEKPVEKAESAKAHGEAGKSGSANNGNEDFDILTYINASPEERARMSKGLDIEADDAVKKEVETRARKSFMEYKNRVLKNFEGMGDNDFSAALRKANSVSEFISLINEKAKGYDDVANDWAGRSYKQSEKRVSFSGKGEDDGLSVGASVTHINEKRRANAVSANRDRAKRLRDGLSKALSDMGIDDADIKYLVGEGKKSSKPEPKSEASVSPSDEYPTVVDKSGKRRLTGIAAQKKAAADAEKKMRDHFAENDPSGSGVFAEWNSRGRLFSEPPYKTVRNANGRGTHKEYYGDPAAEAINHLLDGKTGAERERIENMLFGKKGQRVSSSTTGNDTIYENGDYERVIDDFMKSKDKYDEFVKNGGKTSEELQAEYDASREVKIDGDSYDIEDIEAHGKADKVYDDAVAEVDSVEDGSPFVKNFYREELKNLKEGDTIRFDHSEADYEVESYDPKNNEIVVSVSGAKDNPLFTDAEKAEMTGRRFRLTENGWIELNERNVKNGNERTNAEGADETVPGDAKGKQADSLVLDGGTAEEIAAEQKRIADKAEIERRQNAPLKTGKGEIGQDLLDLGGAEGGDLFNRPQKTDAQKPSNTDTATSPASTSVDSARKLLKEKFFADEKTLAAARAKLPPQAAKLREAYDVAIGEAKKRAAQEAEALNQINERLDLNRLDPKRRSDPKVVEWAKKKGRTVSDGKVTPDALREYDAQLAKSAAKAAKKWFPGMEIVTHDYGEKIERGKNVIDIRDTFGNSIGWFDPGKFETHLLPGANAETVAHEIAWHGTRQWAKVEMGHGNAKAKKLFDKMREVEDNCPAMLKAKILKIYGKHYAGRSIDDFYNEYGAWDFMAKGGEALEKAMQKAENRAWYAKWWDAAKNMVKEAFHANKPDMANIDEIDGMTPEQFKDWLADNFAGGKTLAVRDKPKGAAKISTEETAFQKARRKVYDVNAAIRDLQKDIEKKIGRKLTDREDAEMANALSSGKREAAVMDVKSRIEEYRNELSRLGLSDPDVQYYMALKAAAGRDAKVDNRNIENLRKRMKAEGYSDTEIDDAVNNYQSTNGSHIDPREAKKLIAELEGGEKGNAYRQIRDLLRKTIDETLQAQRDAGLISDAQYREWKAEEPDYIPFKNSFDDVTGEFYGRGVNNFTKPEHYTAKGRQSSAGDITTHIFADYQNTLLRGIETDVRQRLARLVEMNPELGTVEKISDMSKLKQKTTRDRIEDGKIADDRSGDPNVIIFKRGGESYAIRLNGTRGSAIAAGITERNTLRLDNMGKLGKAFSAFSRSQAAMATRRALTFPLRNALKDNIELSNIVFSEKGIVNGTKWVGHYAKGQAANAKALAEYIATGKIDTTTEGGKTLDAYIKAGGLISGGATEGIAKIKSSLTPEAIEKEMKRGLSKTRAVARGTLKAIGFANEYAEMATRLNAFYAERKIGASDERAALFARRATVDFNRHGEWTGVTNVARLFSNSTLGATARATAALAKSKAGMAVAGTMFVNGLAQSLLEYYTNKDADEETRKKGGASGKDVSEYERKTSLFHYRKGDKFYKVAQHESPFSLFNYAGDLMGRTLTGQISAKDAAKNLGVSTAELAYAFTGLGNINVQSREGTIGSDMKAAIVSGAVPSSLQPLAEIMLGIDYKGDPLYRTNMSKTKPNSEVSKSHTPDYAKLAAKNLNEIGGGDASTKSWLDVSPETIQKLVEGYGKNAVKDIMEAYETGKAIINGELPKLDDRSVPFKRDFVRPLDGNTSRYYTAYNQFIRDKGTFDGKTSEKSWKDGERKQFLDDHPWLRKVGEKRRIDYLVDNTNKESPRRGVRGMGVDQLSKLVDGKVYLKRGGKYGYYEPNTPLTDEEIEAAKAELQRKQALVIEIMGK